MKINGGHFMDEKEFLKVMQEDILDIKYKITMETELEEFADWDSLGVIDFIAMANDVYGKKIKRTDVVNAKTCRDLYNLIK